MSVGVTVSHRTPARAIGRPRRLTLRTIVSAARDVGLESITMSAVAARLGVGAATLYTYVDGLDELVRLVAIEQAWRPHLEDVGQHWSEVIADHVRSLSGLFAEQPQLLVQFVQGGLPPDDMLEDVERFLVMLEVRGFEAREAFRIYGVASQLALGVAVAAANAAALRAQGEPRTRSMRLAIAAREDDLAPPLRDCLDAFLDETCFATAEQSVTFLIEAIAAARGETLP